MEHYAAIDVSLEASSVCVVDGSGRVLREAKVASEPEALVLLGDDCCQAPRSGTRHRGIGQPACVKPELRFGEGRKLAIVPHRTGIDGTDFRFGKHEAGEAGTA